MRGSTETPWLKINNRYKVEQSFSSSQASFCEMLQQLKTTCRCGLEPRRLEQGETSWTIHQLITKRKQMIAHSHLHAWGSFTITTCTSLDYGENVQTTHRKGSWGVRTWGFLALRQEISISFCVTTHFKAKYLDLCWDYNCVALLLSTPVPHWLWCLDNRYLIFPSIPHTSSLCVLSKSDLI